MSRLKLLIIALLAGNILLFGLEASKPPVKPVVEAVISTVDEDLPTIQLLREMADMAPDNLNRQCFTVGPFETRPTAEAIASMLRQYTSSVSPRETEAFVDRGYWVYLPPYADKQGARMAVRIIYEAGFDDVALIKNGEWNNSVSLGYFINQSNATQHRDRIRDLGFKVEFQIQREDETRFWVDYEQQPGAEYASRALTGLVPHNLHRATACAAVMVATETEINTS